MGAGYIIAMGHKETDVVCNGDQKRAVLVSMVLLPHLSLSVTRLDLNTNSTAKDDQVHGHVPFFKS
jgi:hypothetical protein